MTTPGKQQIVYGLLCCANGCPVAIEVFEDNTGDPKTLNSQITKLKQRFVREAIIALDGGRDALPFTTYAWQRGTLRPGE